MILSTIKLVSALALLLPATVSASESGEEARWLVNTTLWGTLQWLEPSSSSSSSDNSPPIVQSMLASYGEHDGRIFYYLQSEGRMDAGFRGSLTLSEAQVDPGLFEGARCGVDGDLDPEDPRCAKLTLSGTISPCPEDTKPLALSTLFASHPQMEDWPADHGFVAFEMQVEELWMIANYGGGGTLPAQDYYDSKPVHHPAHFPVFGNRRRARNLPQNEPKTNDTPPRPDFGDDVAGHARWLVAKSLWTTISTVSSRTSDQTFGNIRSVVDGGCFLDSSGFPYFYLPTPDPTAVDVGVDDSIALTFTEAALASRVGEDGLACGGMDAMDPTCARITLLGKARVLDEVEVERAMASFGMQHPRADWLSKGGAHTGGEYYTIDIEGIEFLRTYGGPEEITVDEYVAWVVPDGGYDGEEECSTNDWDGAGEMGEESHYHHGDYEHYEHGMGGGHHDHGGWGEGHGGWDEGHHEHGGHATNEGGYHGHGFYGEYSSKDNIVIEEEASTTLSIGSFLAGTAFGFLFWGPTLALIVYHKRCEKSRRHGDNTAVEYKPAVMA